IYFAAAGFSFFAYPPHFHIIQFPPLIIFLTPLHFHYSPFLIPIFNPLLPTTITKHPIFYTSITSLIFLSPLLIPLPITYSKTLHLIPLTI
ncbi:YndJ family transporter, partial [Bacillus subtilis]|uniref:YndJ family transporter n=1 Tax=Bacillus subtilis TaxID=1423 RepID=UPI0016433BF3